MKALLNIAILLCFSITAEAANYYFSSTTGDDSRTPAQAQNPSTPWKTIEKLNSYSSSFQPGDSLLFARGETFTGTIKLQKSGTTAKPIVFSAYGSTGKSNPLVSGLTSLSGWVNKGNGIWETVCSSCGTSVNMVLINGSAYAKGRFPNSNAANAGYLNFESHTSNTQITDNELTGNWTGAEMVIRPNRWAMDRNPIKQHSGKTITYTSASGYEPINGFGYFIQNHIGTLDRFGEWFYEPSTKKMSVYFGTNDPKSYTLQASMIDNLLSVSGQSNHAYRNITFRGSNADAVLISNAKNIGITACSVQFAGTNGMVASNTSYLTVDNSSINGVHNNSIDFKSCSYTSVTNNKIKNTGVFAGMGRSGNSGYDAITIWGTSNKVEYNNIDSTGNIGIDFQGDSTLVKNNFINYFTFVKDDGGGIYTWTGNSTSKKYVGRRIVGNIILNGVGAGAGTNSPEYLATKGIYMDDNAANVHIADNTIAHCGNMGIFLHNAHEIKITRNTIFNNYTQIHMSQDHATSAIKNNIINGNILFSKWIDQRILFLNSEYDNLPAFGSFDSNYYCRPFDDRLALSTSSVNASGTQVDLIHDLQMWQAAFAKDPSTKKSPLTFPYYTVLGYVGQSKVSNGNFNTSLSGISTYSPKINVTTSLKTGKLDGNALQFSFTSNTGQKNLSAVMIGGGAVTAGKKYVLKFSLMGAKNNRTMEVYLQQTASPYKKLSAVTSCKISTSRSENEFMFTANSTVSDIRIIFDIEEADSTLWMDNIQLYEANITMNNPDDYIRFEYNASKSTKTVSLGSAVYRDAKNKKYSGSMTLAPFTSVVLLKESGTITGVDNNLLTEGVELNVYPNPTNGLLNVLLPGDLTQETSLYVMDLTGRLILTKEVPVNVSEANTFQLDVAEFNPGTYVLIIKTQNKVYQKKFVKLSGTL